MLVYSLLLCSYECGQHEAKAKEKKEELEDQVKQLQSSLTEFEGNGREDGEWEMVGSREGKKERVEEGGGVSETQRERETENWWSNLRGSYSLTHVWLLPLSHCPWNNI